MKARLSIPVALFFLLLVTSPVSASVSNDQVQSQHIREADGTSGQNTNSGAGVKTGHIQNSAVTSAKIQDGQVLNADLASGAVTDAKISGVISAAKLPVGTTSGTVAAGDHNHDNIYQKKYANVVVVAKSGGDFTDPIAAMASITDASAMNPYLLKIMPGVYDLGTGTLSLPNNIDIEGSGENATVITSASDGTVGGSYTVGGGYGNREIRFLTINNTGGLGIGLSDISMTKLTNITITVTGATNSGLTRGIVLYPNADSVMTNVTVNVAGETYSHSEGISFGQAHHTMNNVTVNVSGTNASYQGGTLGIVNNGGDASTTMTDVAVNASGSSSVVRHK